MRSTTPLPSRLLVSPAGSEAGKPFLHTLLNTPNTPTYHLSYCLCRFAQIAEHEASHVAVLSGALGEAAVGACEYTFPYTDPKSFANLAAVIENLGVSGESTPLRAVTVPSY